MPKPSERGVIAHLLLLLLLGAGLVIGVYLVSSGNPLKLFSKASMSKPVGPETSFSLISPTSTCSGWLCELSGKQQPQAEFGINLFVRSDIEEANLFEAKMNFPKDIVEVKEIRMVNEFNEVESYFDNDSGEISIVGGVQAPGLQTKVGGDSILMATIIFKAKALGKGTVSFTDSSAIYSNLNNINILTIKRNYDISVEVSPPSPAPSPANNAFSMEFKVPSNVEVGATFSPNVFIDNAIDLGAFEFTLKYDPTKLKVLNVELERFLGSTGRQAKQLGPVVDNVAGTIDFGGYTLGASPVGPNGKGVIAVLTMQALTEGSTTVTFGRVQITDRTGNIRQPVGDLLSGSLTIAPKPSAKGDGNKDGKINLVDMSILHSSFPPKESTGNPNYRESVDMNSDGKITTRDFLEHRELLIKMGIIRRR